MLCADKHGAFVQPALYEAFGLTVIEAMSCGLPTFATIKGGPAEVCFPSVPCLRRTRQTTPAAVYPSARL
jgi:glycogen synthase